VSALLVDPCLVREEGPEVRELGPLRVDGFGAARRLEPSRVGIAETLPGPVSRSCSLNSRKRSVWTIQSCIVVVNRRRARLSAKSRNWVVKRSNEAISSWRR